MKEIILICGLPGSGKTHLAEKLKQAYNCTLIDDIKYPSQLDDIKDDLIIITDPYLCLDSHRKAAETIIRDKFKNVKLFWMFFENDPQTCHVNAGNRHRRVAEFINYLTKFYTIPEKSLIFKCWRNP